MNNSLQWAWYRWDSITSMEFRALRVKFKLSKIKTLKRFKKSKKLKIKLLKLAIIELCLAKIIMARKDVRGVIFVILYMLFSMRNNLFQGKCFNNTETKTCAKTCLMPSEKSTAPLPKTLWNKTRTTSCFKTSSTTTTPRSEGKFHRQQVPCLTRSSSPWWYSNSCSSNQR